MRKFLSIILIVWAFLWIGSATVLAMNTGFSTEDLEPDIQQNFLSNINLTLVTEEPEKDAVICFDVSDDGLIAVGSQNLTNKIISIYTEDGDFKYGYTFNTSGSFGVEWDGDDIIIYFVRSDVAASFDKSGSNLEIKRIQDTIENDYNWRHSVRSAQRVVGQNTYTMRNNMGFFNDFVSSYSQIVKTNADGSEAIIYDVGFEYAIKSVVEFIFKIILIVFAVLVVRLEFVKQKNKKGKQR